MPDRVGQGSHLSIYRCREPDHHSVGKRSLQCPRARPATVAKRLRCSCQKTTTASSSGRALGIRLCPAVRRCSRLTCLQPISRPGTRPRRRYPANGYGRGNLCFRAKMKHLGGKLPACPSAWHERCGRERRISHDRSKKTAFHLRHCQRRLHMAPGLRGHMSRSRALIHANGPRDR
jgi:hypothetical protein